MLNVQTSDLIAESTKDQAIYGSKVDKELKVIMKAIIFNYINNSCQKFNLKFEEANQMAKGEQE